MSYKGKHAARAWAGKATLAAAVVIAGGSYAGVASASTPDCAFGNGCATLHGSDAAGHGVAMDAKYQKKTEILIGFPDNSGDTATSFDGVLHFTTSNTPVWSDTALLVQQPTNNAFVHRYFLGCIFHDSGNDTATNFDLSLNSGGPADGHTLTWSLTDNTDPDVTIDPATGSISDPDHTQDAATSTADVTVKDGYGDIANAVVTLTEGGSGLSGIVVNSGNCTRISTLPAEQSGGVQFSNTDLSFTGGLPNSANHPESYTWSASGLPTGLSIDPNTGFIAPGTAADGSYGVKVTATDASGAASTITFTLQVNATKSHVANHTPYYTFVFAPHGTWSNQCVTDINGSGALRLTACTLGKDRYQDFFALDGAGNPQQIADSSTQYHFQDWLASIAHGNNSCLIDHSMLNPGTPQSDATDELPTGRQLRVDGDCTAAATLWSWNT